MNFQDLVGKTFQESELYELLLFELEENFENNFSKFIHIYFDRVESNKIRVTELVHFQDTMTMDKKSREIIEKKEWFEIDENQCHLNLLLCRFDRTGFTSSIWKDETRTEQWQHGWADERPRKPMTAEKIRLACLELMGVFQDHQEKQKLRSKKAV